MAMSVLQKPFQRNSNVCGVWCSIQQKWLIEGSRAACFKWKHEREEEEEEEARKVWREEFAKKGYLIN